MNYDNIILYDYLFFKLLVLKDNIKVFYTAIHVHIIIYPDSFPYR